MHLDENDIVEAINYCRAQNCQIVALEQGKGSLNLAEPRDYSEDTALILGEEVHGIPPEVLAHCDKLLEIPMCGKKESFNVSVATGIALWELTKSSLSGTRKHLRTPR